MVAAQHYNADCLVHFGHSCLSHVERMAVFYAFDKLPLDLDRLADQLNTILTSSPNNKIVLLYDIAYFYLYGNKTPLNSIYLKKTHTHTTTI